MLNTGDGGCGVVGGGTSGGKYGPGLRRGLCTAWGRGSAVRQRTSGPQAVWAGGREHADQQR